MTYRSLLLLLDLGSHCTTRTNVAIQMAIDLDCHLVGLAPTGQLVLPDAPGALTSLAQFGGAAWNLMRDQANQATETFHQTCVAAGLKSFEAVVDEAEHATSLVHHAHCSDLTLLTQAEPATPNHAHLRRVVEQVVLFSARPTLVLPYAGHVDSVGRRALVAWDDSREAARALHDALPLLRRAQSVDLLHWNEDQQFDSQTLRRRMDALRQWLLWQGVVADTRVETADIGVAEAMLSRAADLNADLIVMGAWGHTRWTERMLGGATRGLLDAMTVPVLMSH
jgi:nucleotide-binding universal stress UspA family protein